MATWFHHAGGSINLDGIQDVVFDVFEDQPRATLVYLSGHPPVGIVGPDVERLQKETGWTKYANAIEEPEVGNNRISPHKNREELLAGVLGQK